MKPPPHSRPPGSALIIVLGFLALITAIVIAFLSSVTTQLTTSKTVANSASVHQLADSAVNVVMAQIVDATKGQASGETLAWASQPGMIRTYDAGAKPRDFYKLYSSDKMTISGAGFTSTLDLPPPDWNSAANIELYTDINAPALDARGVLVYPIVDPSADGTPNPKLPSEPPMKVEGFSITSSPGFEATMPESPVNNRAPMPVRWLYVLQDGSLRSPTAGSGTITVPGATKINPIVGRIAFWTDDESCKVNINTASEGTYWDTPRVYTQDDYGRYDQTVTGMASNQPAQREYQRYPGHPATTSLSPIFGSFLPLNKTPYPISAIANDAKTFAQSLDPYYAIAPRVGLADGTSGGSRGGSVLAPGTMTVDKDRLYATVDELMFTPRLSGNDRIPNTSTTAAPQTITKDVLEKTRFFLTASSSAPETTLFNTPRISIWPEWVDPLRRTAFEKLLAFCSTINGNSYFFTRNNPKSTTEDFSARNAVLYKYLQSLTSRKIPGFGGDFLSKLGADRDQVLTSIYDYIRCTNLSDSSTGATPYTPAFNASAVTTDASTAAYTIGAGQVVPIKITSGGVITRGYGRMHTISGAALVFYATSADANKKTKTMQAVLLVQFACPMHGAAGMMPNMRMVIPMKDGEGLDLFQAKGKTSSEYKPLGFPRGGTNFIENADVSTWAGRSIGGTEGPQMSITTTWSNTGVAGKKIDQGFTPGSAGKAQKRIYPFVTGQDFVLENPASDTTFNFKGGKFTMEIRTQDTDELVQTLRFNFPDGEFKIPTIPASNSAFASYNRRLANGGGLLLSGTTPVLALAEDTVIQLETAGSKGNANDTTLDATAGDNRMIAALWDVPDTKFRPHLDYSKIGFQFAHSLYYAYGGVFTGAKIGTLVSATYSTDAYHKPYVPSRVGTAVTRMDGYAGDWDTGWGDEPDGAYINKADDGDLSGVAGTLHLAYTLGYAKQIQPSGDTYFSPNRQVPSPLMFGSIPTGMQRMQPWQTLLFNPRPEDNHPGKISPRDHLIADLFWMPVVEPYAISQPFSTSGKINLNYQIAPFTYINRSTGMHALMKSTRFLALPPSDAPNYKPTPTSGVGTQLAFKNLAGKRYAINIPETLKAFDTKFASSDPANNCFKSASQICEMNLVPFGASASYTSDDASMATFWNTNKLTGDNVREKPYVDIYPRLTTKSNTYTVHVRVQTLKKVPGTPPDQWVSGRDQVLGEYRGSSLLERYIDLNDPTLPDFAAKFASNPSDGSLNIDRYYRMRVVSKKCFAP